MSRTRTSLIAMTILPALVGLAWSCSGSPPPPASGEARSDLAASPPAAEPTPEPTPSPSVEPQPEPAASSAPTTLPPPEAAPPSPTTERIEVAAAKPGLTRTGPDTCKMCHKPEYASWAASAHAKLNPPLDCESCHGPGSEYKALAVMKDPAKAKAAGLVMPEASFCTAKCHAKKWSDDFLKKAHAHKGS